MFLTRLWFVFFTAFRMETTLINGFNSVDGRESVMFNGNYTASRSTTSIPILYVPAFKCRFLLPILYALSLGNVTLLRLMLLKP